MLNKVLDAWRSSQHNPQDIPRYVALDWLRVLAFGLLVFFHTGMLYSQNWGFHFKSQYLSEGLENFLLLLSPWRMGLIWFISGAAISCLLQRQTLSRFLLSRTVRILLPLLVGVWLVVPIQLYAQMQQEVGLSMGYAEFYWAFLDLSDPLFKDYQPGIWPHVDVNHLWYLRSLWQFMLIIALILPVLRSDWLQNHITGFSALPLIWVFIGLVAPLLLLKFNWPSDTFRYPMGWVFLLYGFLLVHQRTLFTRLSQHAYVLLTLFVLNHCVVLWGYNTFWRDQSPDTPWWQIAGLDSIYVAQRVLGVMTMLALAMRFLNKPHPMLPVLNGLVFPFYIFHQSVIIGLAYYLSPLELGPWLEPSLIVLLTFALCGAACWVILRLEPLSPLFGVKQKRQYSQGACKLGYLFALLLLLPLILQLLNSWGYMV